MKTALKQNRAKQNKKEIGVCVSNMDNETEAQFLLYCSDLGEGP